MASPEAETVWQMIAGARGAGGASDLERDRELAVRGADMIPAPDAVSYGRDVVAGVPALRVEPEKAVAGAPILWIHGGGFTLVRAHAFRHWVGHVALELHRSVIVPDYGLAPEHPFPVALEEIVGVYRALAAAHPDEPLAIVGASAGGALAVGVQLRQLHDGGQQPALTVLVSPWLDLTLTNPSISDNTDLDVVLDEATLRRDAAAYLNGSEPMHPTASPAHADVSGLGPLLIMASEYDLLLDDSVRFARRCAAAGVDVGLEIAAGMPHCYQFFVTVMPEANAAMSRLAGQIRCRLG